MKDYLSIHEFSRLSGVGTSTLRYWDEIGLFSPIIRNPENNYRYYSPVQLTALNFVTTLSELEIPLKTIGELRNERDPENLLRLLEKHERRMDMEMRRLRRRYSIIHARQELIRYGMRVDEVQLSVLYREDKSLILWPRNKYDDGDTFIEPLTSVVQHSEDYHINLSFPVGGYYDNLASFSENPERPDRFFSVDPTGNYTRKAGDYLIGFAKGYYAELGDLPQRMEAYAKDNSLNLTGPVYLMYLHDEITSLDPTQYLAQACIAVARPKRRR